MHIAIDARLYGVNHTGIGRYTQNLINQLAKLDTSNHYTLFVTDPKLITDTPKKCHLVTANIRHYTFSEQTVFLRLLYQQKADLYHFPHFNVPLLFNKPSIVTIHDLLWHEKIGFSATTLNPATYLAKYLGYRLVINSAVRRASHLITPTNHVKQNLIDRFNLPSEKISVTYEAAASQYSIRPTTNPKLLNRYHLSTPFIIYTGSLYPHKNVISAVKALSHHPDLTLAIASARTVFTDKFLSQVKHLGLQNQVKILGFVPDTDLVALYSQALALTQPSQSEGFGLTGLEAMAAGLPVICSTHPVLKEIYGKAALFVDTSIPKNIASAINQLKSDPKLRNKLSKAGKSQASQYSWQKLGQQTLDIYQNTQKS